MAATTAYAGSRSGRGTINNPPASDHGNGNRRAIRRVAVDSTYTAPSSSRTMLRVRLATQAVLREQGDATRGLRRAESEIARRIPPGDELDTAFAERAGAVEEDDRRRARASRDSGKPSSKAKAVKARLGHDKRKTVPLTANSHNCEKPEGPEALQLRFGSQLESSSLNWRSPMVKNRPSPPLAKRSSCAFAAVMHPRLRCETCRDRRGRGDTDVRDCRGRLEAESHYSITCGFGTNDSQECAGDRPARVVDLFNFGTYAAETRLWRDRRRRHRRVQRDLRDQTIQTNSKAAGHRRRSQPPAGRLVVRPDRRPRVRRQLHRLLDQLGPISGPGRELHG